VTVFRSAISVSLFFWVLFVAMPATVHFYQPDEFEFSALELMAVGALVTAILSIAASLVLLALPSARITISALAETFTVLLGAACLIWPVSSGAITGAEEVVPFRSSENIWQVVIYIAAAMGLFVVLRLFRQIADSALLAAGSVLVGFSVFAGATSGDFGYSEKLSDEKIKNEIAILSPDRNIIVVLLDELTSYILEHAFETEPELKTPFDGFTFFADATSTASRTEMSLPTILSARLYEGGSARNFLNEATADSFLADASRTGYDAYYLNYLQTNCPADLKCVATASYAIETALVELLKGYVESVRFGVLRVAPIGTHRWVSEKRFAAVGGWIIPALGPRTNFEDHLQAQVRFNNEIRIESGVKPKIHFHHLAYTHYPIDFNADCKYIGPTWPQNTANLLGEAKCGIRMLGALIARLKEIGAYDQTALLFISDHGFAKYFRGIKFDPNEMPFYPGEEGAYQSAMLIKPPHTRGAMKTSQAPASLLDIRATVCSFIEGCDFDGRGVDVRTLSEGSEHQRLVMQFRSWAMPRRQDGAYRPESYKFVEFSGGVDQLKEALFSPPSYKLGEEISFRTGGNSRLYTFSGWAMPQQAGTFNDTRSGSAAIIQLPIDPKPEGPLTLQARVQPFLSDQKIRLTANSTEIAHWSFEKEDIHTVTAVIPAEIAVTGNPLRLEFVADRSASPSMLNEGNNDLREMGFQMIDMSVQ
jgi:hypothetical protein